MGLVPQPPPSATGLGENPGQQVVPPLLVELCPPEVFAVLGSGRDYIYAYLGRPSTPRDGWWYCNNDNAKTCSEYFHYDLGRVETVSFAVGLRQPLC